jgi:hypothetical protein
MNQREKKLNSLFNVIKLQFCTLTGEDERVESVKSSFGVVCERSHAIKITLLEWKIIVREFIFSTTKASCPFFFIFSSHTATSSSSSTKSLIVSTGFYETPRRE